MTPAYSSNGRRSGRTTAMLEQALAAIRRGLNVRIVVHNHAMFQYVSRLHPEIRSRVITLRRFSRGGVRGECVDRIYLDHAVWDVELRVWGWREYREYIDAVRDAQAHGCVVYE